VAVSLHAFLALVFRDLCFSSLFDGTHLGFFSLNDLRLFDGTLFAALASKSLSGGRDLI
jgi:hypothetical protein